MMNNLPRRKQVINSLIQTSSIPPAAREAYPFRCISQKMKRIGTDYCGSHRCDNEIKFFPQIQGIQIGLVPVII